MNGIKRSIVNWSVCGVAWALLPGAAFAGDAFAKAAAVSPGLTLYVKHCYSCHDDPKYDLGHINRGADPAKTSAKIAALAAMQYLKNLTAAELKDIAAYIAATPAATVVYPVVEYFHTKLDHYFVTGDPEELTWLDSHPDMGWTRTGNTFKASGSTPVCRFYGSAKPGPDSHFFTVSSSECDSLKQLQASTPATLPRWNFEGLAFYTRAPVSGACPSGTLPVYRAYNNGWTRGIDSNHRLSRSPAAIKEVVARGWTDEGIVMCAPG
ncbi:MAG: hypothetical protein HY777_02150 [Betaproteobacteria bacterium]|nr:hypothetical protein [Betaproteobacteria bacterium]